MPEVSTFCFSVAKVNALMEKYGVNDFYNLGKVFDDLNIIQAVEDEKGRTHFVVSGQGVSAFSEAFSQA